MSEKQNQGETKPTTKRKSIAIPVDTISTPDPKVESNRAGKSKATPKPKAPEYDTPETCECVKPIEQKGECVCSQTSRPATDLEVAKYELERAARALYLATKEHDERRRRYLSLINRAEIAPVKSLIGTLKGHIEKVSKFLNK
jgi:hypothetical protein